MEDPDDRLQAFCSITLDDCFVVRDLKIIEGANGPFVAMPSRKLTAHCPQCGCKNHLRAAYCNQCGQRLKDDSGSRHSDGRAKLYADIAHPINSACRELIQERVIAEYRAEQERASEPGYVSRYDDDYDLLAEAAEDLADDAAEAARPKEKRERHPESRAHIEPAESQTPSPPHTQTDPRSNRDATRSDRPKSTRDGEFGAGIF
jgi:stage V sporulation protein G